jgi:uncharacterized protein
MNTIDKNDQKIKGGERMKTQINQRTRNIFFTDFYGKSQEIDLSIGIDTANMCQLNCTYCYFGQKGTRKMDIEMVFPAVQNLIGVFEPKLHSVNVHYMGGEPLLAWEEIVKLNSLVKGFLKRKELKFNWSLTSNLVALDEHKAEHMIREGAGIHCSIDGPAFIQDKNRPYRDGRGSFQDVVKNIPLALSITPDDFGRATVRPEDARFLPEISETILGLGFKHIFLYPEVGRGWEEIYINDWAKGIAKAYARSGGSVGNEKIGTLIRLVKGKNPKTHFTYCGAGRGLWSLDVNGHLYHCYHFSNLPEYAIIDASISSPEKIRMAIEESLLPPQCADLPEKCLNCPANYSCSGGCWASNFLIGGDASVALKSHCRLSEVTAMALEERLIEAEEESCGIPIMQCCTLCHSSCYSCVSGCTGCYTCDNCLTCYAVK